jgi:hypothetical protein
VTAAHIHGLSGDVSGLPSRKRRQGLDLSSDFVVISLCRPPAKPAAQIILGRIICSTSSASRPGSFLNIKVPVDWDRLLFLLIGECVLERLTVLQLFTNDEY